MVSLYWLGTWHVTTRPGKLSVHDEAKTRVTAICSCPKPQKSQAGFGAIEPWPVLGRDPLVLQQIHSGWADWHCWDK